MDIDPSVSLGDPGPSTLANRLRRLTALPDELESDPLVRNTLRTLRSHATERPLNMEEDDEALTDTPDDLEPDDDPHAFGLEEDEIQEYELTAWDVVDIAIEQEAQGTYPIGCSLVHLCLHCSTSGYHLDYNDMDTLRIFSWQVQNNLTQAAISQLPLVFPDRPIPTWKVVMARALHLAGIEPVFIDCCTNSCMAFTGSHEKLKHCTYCKQPRFTSSKKPRKRFCYLPLIPRLKMFSANTRFADLMRYRVRDHQHNPGVTSDVFDGSCYQSLLNQHVSLNGKKCKHRFFADDTDIALGLSTDGFAPFKKRTQTAWPLLVYNYNLPPDVRFHLEHIICLGVVPGPRKPHDFDSFLWPLVEELLRLEMGVAAHDDVSERPIVLRAFLILVFGDIPAISMVMRMKGHGAVSPCRFCKIKGVRVPSEKQNKRYYVPLDRSTHPLVEDDPAQIPVHNPHALPLRTHEEFMRQACEVENARPTQSKALAKEYGIKGVPLLSHLSSLTFPHSFPYEFMHIIWENLIPNLIDLWTDKFKNLDSGSEDYTLTSSVWTAIGRASEACGSSIPAAMGPRPFNVATDSARWTADSRSFWTLYLAPTLLERRFKKAKYYDHFIDLVVLLNTCLKFDYTSEDVDFVRNGFIKWVDEYET
jgi:hypothetical protein